MELKATDTELKSLERHGFFIHYHNDLTDKEGTMNAHTHGLEKSHKHLNLQLVVKLPQSVAEGVLWAAVRSIKDGGKFQSGIPSSNVLEGFNVTFIEAKEGGRNVLRLILPDKTGSLNSEEAEYKAQWSVDV